MRAQRYFYVVAEFTVRRWLAPCFHVQHAMAFSTDGEFPGVGDVAAKVMEEHRKRPLFLERSTSQPSMTFFKELSAQDFSELVGKGEFLRHQIARLERRKAEERAREAKAEADRRLAKGNPKLHRGLQRPGKAMAPKGRKLNG